MKEGFRETKTRTLAKTILWRVIGTFITLAVVYSFDGELFRSAKISVIVAVFLMVGYYVNERVWNRVRWGKVQKTE